MLMSLLFSLITFKAQKTLYKILSKIGYSKFENSLNNYLLCFFFNFRLHQAQWWPRWCRLQTSFRVWSTDSKKLPKKLPKPDPTLTIRDIPDRDSGAEKFVHRSFVSSSWLHKRSPIRSQFSRNSDCSKIRVKVRNESSILRVTIERTKPETTLEVEQL